jgi:NAD(P)H-dependent FMN reductase
MRLFAFAASLRRESLNRKLLRLAVQTAERAGASVDHADFREFDMPLYDKVVGGFVAFAGALAKRP